MTLYIASATTATAPYAEVHFGDLATEAGYGSFCVPHSDPVNELYSPYFLTKRDAAELRNLPRSTNRGRMLRTRP